jgi:Zn-finger protein
MRMEKGQTKICKKCRAEMSWTQKENGRYIFVCEQCGSVSRKKEGVK